MNYCGCACSEMVLSMLGISVTQKTMFGLTHDPNKAIWGSTPDLLSAGLKQYVSGPGSSNFERNSTASEEGLSRKICWAIKKYGTRPIALVYGRGHWIVVNGFQSSAEPASSDDADYQISNIFIDNPYMQRSKDSATNGHALYEVVPYAEWRRHYLAAPVPSQETDLDYRGYYIGILDQEPAGSFVDQMYVPNIPSGATPIPTIDAAQTAENLLSTLDVFQVSAPWYKFPGQVRASAILLDRDSRWLQDDSYFVAFEWINPATPEHLYPLLMRISALDGTFRGAVAVPDGSTYLEDSYIMLYPNDMMGHLQSIKQEFRPRNSSIVFYADQGQLEDALYWQPCLESLTPFMPFYVINFSEEGTQQTYTFYIRLDGQVFPAPLTEAVGA